MTSYLNSADIPEATKSLFIGALPEGQFFSIGHINGYLQQVQQVIDEYVDAADLNLSSAQDAYNVALNSFADAQELAVDTAQDVLDALDDFNAADAAVENHAGGATTAELEQSLEQASKTLADYQAAYSALQQALEDQANNDELQNALESAEAELDLNLQLQDEALSDLINAQTLLDEVTADSIIGTEDLIFNFEIGHDLLTLPTSALVSDVTGNFQLGETSYEYNVFNGVLNFTAEDVVVVPSGAQIDTLLDYLSDDSVVADGDTVVFEYDRDGDKVVDGIYVFQGHAGRLDIGVKLVGLTAAELGTDGALALFDSYNYLAA